MGFEGWFALSAFIVVGLHSFLIERRIRRAYEKQALLQTQLEMLREAIALSEYGARDEAIKLIEDAVSLGGIGVSHET